jgi:hypothetical protein
MDIGEIVKLLGNAGILVVGANGVLSAVGFTQLASIVSTYILASGISIGLAFYIVWTLMALDHFDIYKLK